MSHQTHSHTYKTYTRFYCIFSVNIHNYQTKVLQISNIYIRLICEGVKQVTQTHIMYCVIAFDMKKKFLIGILSNI